MLKGIYRCSKAHDETLAYVELNVCTSTSGQAYSVQGIFVSTGQRQKNENCVSTFETESSRCKNRSRSRTLFERELKLEFIEKISEGDSGLE